jgi:serine/threonine protein kinase
MGFSEDRERADRLLQDLSEKGLGPAPASARGGATAGGSEEVLLGKLALDRGLVTREQLEDCLREAVADSMGERNRLLGKIFISRGYAKPEVVLDLLEEQTRRSQGIPSIPRYQIQDKIGEGASAVVYQARDTELKRLVALKVLRMASGLSPTARVRFHREAEAAAMVSHPNVVSVYDIGEIDGLSYLVLELIDGRSLSQVLKDRAGDGPGVIALLEKAARGVAAAHAKGIVHRDLKPDNILVTRSGEPKVGDFGLAHLVDPSVQLTRTGASLGTPIYMAPEQARGASKDVSPQTDVYALGAMLYEAVLGRPPFLAETLPEIYAKIVHETPTPPRQLQPKIAPPLETIILKALEKDPKDRYADAGAFADDLQRYREGKPILARPPRPASAFGRRLARHPVASLLWLLILLSALPLAFVLRKGSETPPISERRPAPGPRRDAVELRPDFSKMWKGKELWEFGGGHYGGVEGQWEALAGSTVAFVYTGRGPLPKPIEFVIPLEPPLPMGNYRLFVKNFYVGKMEATLGDITLPLTTRRFDWTPGVTFETNGPIERIVLRYFSTDIVADTGAKQEQYYIVQGLFLTADFAKVPIRGGEIVTSAPDEKPPLHAGNYLQNASFECGLYPWGKAHGCLDYVLPQSLDSTTAVDGNTSLRIGARNTWALDSKMLRLSPGLYALSFHAKADRPMRVRAELYGLSGDLKSDASTKLAQEFEVTTAWTRFSVRGDVEAKPGLLYAVRIGGRQETPATVWLDALQLENGEPTGFRTAARAEAGLVCDLPGRIVYEGQRHDAELLVYDPSGAPSAEVSWRVIDYWGRVSAQGRMPVALAERRGKATLSLYAERRGIFRVLLTLGASTSEMTYSVLPPNPHLESDYPQGSLGVDSVFVDPAHLAILKRANFNWVISKFLGRWFTVEPEEGRFSFDDDAVAAARRAKMTLLIQPGNIEWGAQAWLRPYWKPGGGAVWEEGKRRFYMEHWGSFVEALARHYRDSVKHWEIENEPNCVYSADEYAELLKRASKKIRSVDSGATVVAVAGGGFPEPFYEEVIRKVGPETFDRISVHFYGNELADHQAFAGLLQKYGKRGWNTETGSTCPTFYATLPDFESLRQKEYQEILQRDVRSVATQAAQNYLLSRSLGGMERWFHYFARGVNAGPAQPTARFGGGKELTEYDGALRANAVALSIASHFMDEAAYHGSVALDPRIQAYLFAKGGGTVGCCWASAGQPASVSALPKDLAFYDIMGNPLAGDTLTLADSVVYFSGRAAPADCAKALNQARVAR